MALLKPIQLRERDELEPLIASQPEAVEEGLVILARQLPTDSGPLDILAVDNSGAAVVMELKVAPDDEHLIQGLRYYDWVAANIAWIANVYPQVESKSTPRLMLIAPEFTDTVRRVAKYISLGDEVPGTELIEYTALELPDGNRSLVCKSLEVGVIPEAPEVPSIEEKARLFQSDDLRALFRRVVDDLTAAGAQLRPLHEAWISAWHRERRFMYLACKKKFIIVDLKRADSNSTQYKSGSTWTGRKRIQNASEWQTFLTEEVLPTITAMGRGNES
jgi:hypothetical protein